MLISLNWIRDFVDLPGDLDPKALAERFTRITAEVDGVVHIEVSARGLIAARIDKVDALTDPPNRRVVTLNVGGKRTIQTVSAAPSLPVGASVVYAPVGSSLASLGKITTAQVAGTESVGMILPGEAIGIAAAIQEAIFLSDEFKPGEPLPAELFDDWVIEVDNKSITHRPDLWGHYGIAREIAAIVGAPLKPYPVAAIEKLRDKALPDIPITIADAAACPRYTALAVAGVPTKPAPLWMQLRLGHVGLRPISGLVDLTNYVMADLGQPMHAFDAAKVERIEVDWAKKGESFRTLDGVERTLTSGDLMIQSSGRSVALAGVMGGLETEVAERTSSLLLESANFEPTTIRRTAHRLALRSDASARFEKSLDPAHTVLALQRFIELARAIYPDLKITGRLSDSYPDPRKPTTVDVNPEHVTRTVGRSVSCEKARELLGPLGFTVQDNENLWSVGVPSFRATGDVSIEADVIEELARCMGYDTIAAEMPRVSVRQLPCNELHELEQKTLAYFTTAHVFNEIHGYLWHDARWLKQLGAGAERCIELVNPSAEGLHQLRRTLMPGVLSAVVRNRFQFPALAMIELGSVFTPESKGEADHEYRHVALLLAQRGKRTEDELGARLRGAISEWAWCQFGRPTRFVETGAHPAHPWQHPQRTADVFIDQTSAGRISVVDLPVRRKMDEHLTAWGICWAELWLSNLAALTPVTEALGTIPAHPLVEMDFSILVPRSARFDKVVTRLGEFNHDLLQQIRFVTSYEGKAIDGDRRSLTFRTILGSAQRTLVDDDADAFRNAFEKHITDCGYEIRSA
ncbi:MAG: phenylalanine--tRNA ligase subunit beta [Planctomycetes bacterium]|nr:phenylalanine--tRNA ligase subunit beta [Planctomycetota bacterium]